MNKQQQQLLTMLKEIHAICEQHSIPYCISSGTLIGAVRHGGFLPWDDDADVFMTWENWQRFKKACETSLPPNRHLGSAELQESYGHIVPRYVATDTTAFHTCQSLHDDVAGEVIDIFILDPVADGDEAYRAYLQDMYLYSSIATYSNAAGWRVELDPERFRSFLNMQHEDGRLPTIHKLEQLLTTHFDPEGSDYVLRWQSVPKRFQRSWFSETVPVRFEDTTLRAPKGINEYLTCYYGEDWAEIPAKISASKHNTASSLEFPYTQALEYYHPSFDRSALLEATERRRYLIFKTAPLNNCIKEKRVAAKARVVESQLQVHLSRNRELFDAALHSRDGATLAFILDDYLTCQTSKEMIGRNFNARAYRLLNPVLLDVDKDVFEAALLALVATDRTRFVIRLADLWQAKKGALSAGAQEIVSAVQAFRASANDYQYGRYNEGLTTALRLHDEYPESGMFEKLVCVHLQKLQEQTGDPSERLAFEQAVQAGREKHPADGFYLKLQADIVASRGEEETAHELYLQAAESTRNGFALLDIARKTGYYPEWERTPAWAAKAGIPQWDGATPEPLPEHDTPRVPHGFAPDTRQLYLFDLLCELTELCQEHDIPYVLAPNAAHAFFKQGYYPGTLGGYAVLCRPRDMRRLLKASLPATRIFEHAGNSPAVNDRTLRYHGTDSLLLSWSAEQATRFSSLYVTVLPLEPKPYPRFTRKAARTAKKLQALESPARPARARALRFLRKQCNKFLSARIAAAQDSPLRWKHGRRFLDFDASWMENAASKRFHDHDFAVPQDLDAYLSRSGLQNPGKPSASLQLSPSLLGSAHMDYKQLAAEGLLDSEYFEQLHEARRQSLYTSKVSERFRRNFSQMKLAVRLKELSLELLPRKEEIRALAEQGDFDQLSEVLADYIACAKAFEKDGKPLFDKELYDIMLKTRSHARR